MSSINPAFLLPEALAARPQAIAEGFAGSLTMGAGQFCTNPGLLVGLGGSALDAFMRAASSAVQGSIAQTMLNRRHTPPIRSGLLRSLLIPGFARSRGALRRRASTSARPPCSPPRRPIFCGMSRSRPRCSAPAHWWWSVPTSMSCGVSQRLSRAS